MPKASDFSDWRDLPDDLPLKQKRKAEQAVLTHVVAKHPAHLTFTELMRDMSVRAHDERHELKQAVSDLACVGLLCLQGEVILPSGVTLRFEELFG